MILRMEVTKRQAWEQKVPVDRGQQSGLQRRDRTDIRCCAQRPHQHLGVGSVTASIRRPVGTATNISRLVSEAGVLRRPGGRWRTPWRLGDRTRGLPEAKGYILGLLEAGTGIWRPLEAEADIWRSRGAQAVIWRRRGPRLSSEACRRPGLTSGGREGPRVTSGGRRGPRLSSEACRRPGLTSGGREGPWLDK